LKINIGRNDPCHCGSGKKYKRCHLAEDERRAAPAPEAAPDAEPPSPPPDIHQITGLLREKERAEFARLLAQTQPVLAYMQRQEEIESASKALEAHRAEFCRLAEDEEAYLSQVRALFAEERFAPLRFTADDVRRAFDKVGQPPNLAADDRVVENLRAAILHLADQERRSQLAMELLLHLPDYVAAGRYLDGWLIQHCAYNTTDDPEESNPFLFQMFSYGYDAWAAQQHTRGAALLGELGMDLDRLQSMSLEEVDAWMQAQQADPAKKARMEALLLANPEQSAQATASLEAMERDSVKLLEREDATALLLSPEEIKPWLPRLNEWMAAVLERMGGDASEAQLEETEKQAIAEKLWPVLADMAEGIFTPERIRQLIAQLKTYRNERFAAGEKRFAGCTLGAIASLEREDDPAKNYFLNALCLASLRRPTGATPGPDSEP
jgi:hypothetical protein